MKGKSAEEKHHDTLRRIAALLLALAVLAERAACRSWPVRSIVLWLLRPAEAVARTYAAEVAASPFVAAESPALAPADGAGEALCLAAQLRALAAVYSALIHQVALRLVWIARHPDPGCRRLGRPNVARLDRLLIALRPRAADTS